MIVPTAAQMLKTVQHCFDAEIRPDLSSTATRSAAATISHMLRIVTLRIETEGQLLLDEGLRLDALLPRVRGWLVGKGLPAAASIAAVPPIAPGTYPSLALMAERTGCLREGLCDALETLQAAELDAAGMALLDELRGMVAWQIEQEGRMIDPGTIGHGPRR